MLQRYGFSGKQKTRETGWPPWSSKYVDSGLDVAHQTGRAGGAHPGTIHTRAVIGQFHTQGLVATVFTQTDLDFTSEQRESAISKLTGHREVQISGRMLPLEFVEILTLTFDFEDILGGGRELAETDIIAVWNVTGVHLDHVAIRFVRTLMFDAIQARF